MAVYKRGDTYWFEFVFKGHRIRRSAKTKSRTTARDIECAYRTRLARNEVGLQEPKTVPRFNDAIRNFLEWSKHEHAGVQD